MKIQKLFLTMLVLTSFSGACAHVPPPPHCKDNGMGLYPINSGMMNAISKPEKPQVIAREEGAKYERETTKEGS